MCARAFLDLNTMKYNSYKYFFILFFYFYPPADGEK